MKMTSKSFDTKPAYYSGLWSTMEKKGQLFKNEKVTFWTTLYSGNNIVIQLVCLFILRTHLDVEHYSTLYIQMNKIES